ncbi:hypothetical protein NIES2101_24005 [Calothrix sp. HK-06]|nr:hypothetical protein NIES2101_23870 [Calothrix sp. HK-06]OKH47332.1 hypothetical protein NIES2101_24005 [Calothrix sp. HK-06]
MELNDNDVLDLENSPRLGANPTCQISELKLGLRTKFVGNQGNEQPDYQFFRDGVQCQLLSSSGKGWQKGKLKFELVFIPDESPKPTDAVMGNGLNGED